MAELAKESLGLACMEGFLEEEVQALADRKS